MLLVAVCLCAASASPAFAGYLANPETGKNLNAWPKGQTIWVVHLSNPDDPSMEGRVQMLETACHEGVGFRLESPGVAGTADHAIITVEGHKIRLDGYQLGFCFVLEQWPDPWPFDEVYADAEETMPMFVYFGGHLTASEFLDALAAGGVKVEVFDSSDNLLLTGTLK